MLKKSEREKSGFSFKAAFLRESEKSWCGTVFAK